MSDDLRSLTGLLDSLWSRLNPSCLLTLATVRPEGGAAARMVVLRDADRTEGTVTIYTHRQSEKTSQIRHNPAAELVLWDPESAFQARMTVDIEMSRGRHDLWENLSPGARLNYASFPAQGTRITDPIAASVPSPDLFAILTARIRRLDLLHLGALPHMRAVFEANEDFTGRWVAP